MAGSGLTEAGAGGAGRGSQKVAESRCQSRWVKVAEKVAVPKSQKVGESRKVALSESR